MELMVLTVLRRQRADPRKWRLTAGDHLRRKGNTPGACHEGISDTGELASRVRSIIVEFSHQVEQAISTHRGRAMAPGDHKGTQ